MINYLARAMKRFAVLVPGIIIAFFSVRDIFPWFDKKLPLALAILATYIIGAYILIPALIRLIRAVVPVRHLQSYSVTPDGFASDPVNIGVIGSRRELIMAMEDAGWHVADPHRLEHLFKAGLSILLNREYATAPVSNLYLFGRKQDISFEIPIASGRGHRHHVRFWATSYTPGSKLNFGTMEWHGQNPRNIGNNTLWVGAASRDSGFAFIRHNAQVTHMIHPDTNAERQLIIDSLKQVKLVSKVEKVRLRRPYRVRNRVWRGHLRSDGTMSVVTLRKRT